MKARSLPLAGILLCLIIGAAALRLSRYVPVGAVALAILIGIIVGNLIKLGPGASRGVTICERKVLSVAIALMGVNLNYMILRDLGYGSILLVICAVALTIITGVALGRIFGLDRRFALLLGIGNAVCGSSAIAATQGLIDADEDQVGLSVAIVNFMGTIGIFLAPFIGAVVLRFSDLETGLLIGNTLQAVGQVVASGFSVSDAAGQTATIVKMARVLMLTPVMILLVCFRLAPRDGASGSKRAKFYNFPLFIFAFILFSLIPTFALLPPTWIKGISLLGRYALILAMAGIGLKITFGNLLRNGRSALLIGGLIFGIQLLFSGGVIALFFR